MKPISDLELLDWRSKSDLSDFYDLRQDSRAELLGRVAGSSVSRPHRDLVEASVRRILTRHNEFARHDSTESECFPAKSSLGICQEIREGFVRQNSFRLRWPPRKG